MRRKVLVSLISLLLVAAACGKNTGTTSSKAIDGILLKSADLPSMRIVHELPASVTDFANILAGGEVFKDDPDVAEKKLKGFGYKRGYIEDWNGAGLQGGAFMAEFDTEAHATAVLAYMKTELFRPCPNEPTCSSRVSVPNAGIPNFVGEALTPLRPADEGKEFTVYKFVFRIGSAIFGMKDGGDDGYDPSSVSKAQALDVANALYDRVKGKSFDAVFKATPDKPLGPPPDRGPPPPSPGA